MIRSGDISARGDSDAGLYVAVLSNATHLQAGTGRLIVCPFVPGPLPEEAMPLVVPVAEPEGVLLPELVQWLPASALDAAIGNVGGPALRQAASIVGALVDHC